MKRIVALLAFMLATAVFLGPVEAAVPLAPRFGGVLKATINSNPASFDPMLESGEYELVPGSHIFETALTTGIEGEIYGGLCTFEVKDGGLTLELALRDGLKFHDGAPVTMADLEASAKRWLSNVAFAKAAVGGKLAAMEVSGNRLILTFKEAAPLALTAIGAWNRGLYVMPEWVCEKYANSKIEKDGLVGTGPYAFKDYQIDRFVVLEKFRDYVPYASGGRGLAASKHGYADVIYFYIVSDKTARITGVQTGEYDVAIGVPFNMIETMRKDPNLAVEVKELGIMAGLVFNFKEGPCADVNLRNAILACLDMDDLMKAAQGDPSLYYLNPSVMQKSSRWWTGESLGKYNKVDIERAKEYLKASSYDGRPLVFITTKANDYFYKTALLVQQMVKAAGIEVDVQVYDNPTLRQFRARPDKFDMFSTGLTAKGDPTLLAFMGDGWPGFYSSEKKDLYMDLMTSKSGFADRLDGWVEMTKVLYEELPIITFGERNVAVVRRKNIHDLFETTEKYYWNTWIGE